MRPQTTELPRPAPAPGGSTWLQRLSGAAEDSLRAFAMRAVLDPAAAVLPRRVSMAIAGMLAAPLLALPVPGLKTYWEFRSAFGHGRLQTLRMAHRWLARPLRDHVALRRLASGRQSPRRLRIVEANADAIRELRESGESFIVGCAHFTREAYAATRNPRIVPGRIVQVGTALPSRTRNLHDLRIRIQYGTMVTTLGALWDRQVEVVAIGDDPLPARTLLQRLNAPGHVVMMDVDALRDRYETCTIQRPFAGMALRRFSTGAAQLARRTGCPLVACACRLRDDGSILVEWGRPLRQITDPEAAMHSLLDFLERRVGESPDQYVRSVGGHRRWDPASGRWKGRSE